MFGFTAADDAMASGVVLRSLRCERESSGRIEPFSPSGSCETRWPGRTSGAPKRQSVRNPATPCDRRNQVVASAAGASPQPPPGDSKTCGTERRQARPARARGQPTPCVPDIRSAARRAALHRLGRGLEKRANVHVQIRRWCEFARQRLLSSFRANAANEVNRAKCFAVRRVKIIENRIARTLTTNCPFVRKPRFARFISAIERRSDG